MVGVNRGKVRWAVTLYTVFPEVSQLESLRESLQYLESFRAL